MAEKDENRPVVKIRDEFKFDKYAQVNFKAVLK